MGYKESDFQIIMVDDEEDEIKNKKRGLLFIFGVAAALSVPVLMGFLVMSLMTGNPEASVDDRGVGAPGDPNARAARLIQDGTGSGASVGQSGMGASRKTLNGRRGLSVGKSNRGTSRHRAYGKGSGGGRVAYTKVSDTRSPVGNNEGNLLTARGLKAALQKALRLNPDLYKGVKIHLLNDNKMRIDLDIDSNVLAATDQDEILKNVDMIETLLRNKYPGVVPSVTLKLSDGMPDFKLRTLSLVEDYIHQTIKSQFLHISPRIYKSVDVEVHVEKTKEGWRKDIWKSVQVKKVDILVNSKEWDAEPSTDKVTLLHHTARFLKNLYSDVTPFVTLKFDDGRADLRLKSVKS